MKLTISAPWIVGSLALFLIIMGGVLHFMQPQKIVPSEKDTDPLTIDYLRQQEYPGSDISIEETLPQDEGYQRYIVSYRSEGLKIYALMAVPLTEAPENGFPAVVIAHGDVPTTTYDRTEKYVTQTEEFAKNGYIVLMPDYRGHADSEGKPTNAYAFPDYIIDTLNAISSLQKHPDVNADSIGIWSHSTGGHIALRALVVEKDIKAAVFWGGVVGSFEELLANWPTYWEYTNQPAPKPDPTNPQKDWRAFLTENYNDPKINPEGWKSISATSYLDEVDAPIQLHHAVTDEWVPHTLSQDLQEKFEDLGKPSELISYEDDNHNLQQNNDVAMEKTIEFFDTHLKKGQG